jgi:hypothetical protein
MFSYLPHDCSLPSIHLITAMTKIPQMLRLTLERLLYKPLGNAEQPPDAFLFVLLLQIHIR